MEHLEWYLTPAGQKAAVPISESSGSASSLIALLSPSVKPALRMLEESERDFAEGGGGAAAAALAGGLARLSTGAAPGTDGGVSAACRSGGELG